MDRNSWKMDRNSWKMDENSQKKEKFMENRRKNHGKRKSIGPTFLSYLKKQKLKIPLSLHDHKCKNGLNFYP